MKMSELCELNKTAPEAIYLQISDDDEHFHEPFPRDVEGITWCAYSVLDCEVKYIRADLYEAALARIAESRQQNPAAYKAFKPSHNGAYSVLLSEQRFNPAGIAWQVELFDKPIIQPTQEEAAWRPLSGAGQIREGFKVRFLLAGKVVEATAKMILRAGTAKEEVVYNRAKNNYFITSMAIDGTSAHKNVEFLSTVNMKEAVAQARVEERDRLGKLIHYPECWDTACYETLESALAEIGCSEHSKGESEKSANAEFELYVNDALEASASGLRSDALNEIRHYATQYAQDGDIEILEVFRTPMKLGKD